MPTWADVVRIGTQLEGVVEGTSYRTPALKAGKTLMCRLKEDAATLMVRVVDLDDKEALLHGHPDVLFTTPHYEGYASVLVRLAGVGEALLGELIEDAWRLGSAR